MVSERDDQMKDLTIEAYQDAIQTFKSTREICQRLEKWAMKELIDPCISLPVHDLAQYCEATIQQYNSYFVDGRKLCQSEFVQEQVWRGLGTLGFEPDENSNEYDLQMLDLLLSECKRRTVEVLDMLDKKLARSSIDERPDRRHKQADPVAQQSNDFQRFSIAIAAILKNITSKSQSQYMLDKRCRTERELETHLLPQIFAFGESLSGFAEDVYYSEISSENPYPERDDVQEFLDKFLCLSNDCMERLQTILDPLNVQSYDKSSEVPYKKVIGATVGTGSFGVVYKAENINTGNVVAVKQLNGIYTSKSQATVRKELSMLEICDHPNIVRLLDAYQVADSPSTFYLVMDPWAPYTLSEFLHQTDSKRHQDSPWFSQGSHKTERRVLRIFRGLADGLSYLHDKSIKHKDLKPDNILFYDAGPSGIRPVIADLGISKIFKHGNPTDYNKSTYAYLAPEQVNSTGSTLRSDVWQLGCCFALMLAVFRQGSAGCQRLWSSFENTDEGCSCNIALEASSFMEAFKILCGHGSLSQLRAYWLTTAMLEKEPDQRLDIQMVKTKLTDL